MPIARNDMPRPVAQVLRQPRPVEGRDRTREDANQEQPEHLVIADQLSEADRRPWRARRASRSQRDSRHLLLVGKDREPRQQPQQAERGRDDEGHRHAEAELLPEQRQYQKRRNDRTELGASVEDAARGRPAGAREQPRDRFNAGGVVAALGQTHQEAQHDESGQAPMAGSQGGRGAAERSTTAGVHRSTRPRCEPCACRRDPSTARPGICPSIIPSLKATAMYAYCAVGPLPRPRATPARAPTSTCRSSRLIAIDAASSPTIVQRVCDQVGTAAVLGLW